MHRVDLVDNMTARSLREMALTLLAMASLVQQKSLRVLRRHQDVLVAKCSGRLEHWLDAATPFGCTERGLVDGHGNVGVVSHPHIDPTLAHLIHHL